MTTPIVRLEVLTDRLLRSRGARYAGLAVGIAAVVFLTRSLGDAGDGALGWFRSLGATEIAATALAFAVLHVGSVVTLRPLFGGPALRIWGAAQLVKYLPVPGSALLGMVGSTVRSGGTSRQGVAVTIRHALLHVGAATVVGLPAAAPALDGWIGLPAPVTVGLGLLSGLGTAWLGVRHLPRRTVLWVIATSIATWVAMGVLLWWGVAQGLGDTGWAVARIAAAFAASWVVGQVALPVPAGIGVREFVVVLLLGPVIGEVGAVSFALVTRLAHVASDAAVAAVMLARGGWRSLRGGVADADVAP